MEESAKLKHWKKRVAENGAEVVGVETLSIVKRPGDSESYVEVYDTRFRSPEEGVVPRVIVLRGDTVQVVPVLECTDDGKFYTVLAAQRRISDGSITCEYIGGMIDPGEDPGEASARESMEEVGVEVGKDEIHSLLHPVSLCTSLMDEKIHFMYFKKQLTMDQIKALDHQNRGLENESEFIKTKVIEMKEILRLPNISNNTIFATLLANHKLSLF